MRVLVACEESQAVCKAFREKGHEAYSCDIIECSGGHPEWHIQEDVLPLLNGNCEFKTTDGKQHYIEGKWDMIIAFPPCTHLAVSGARHFEQKRADGRQKEGVEFFCQFLNADCEKIAVENPVGIISGKYIKQHFPDLVEKYGLPKEPTQIIHPWMFGDNYSKSTCLWLKGISPLVPIVTEQPELEWFEWTDGKTGKKKRQPKWFADAWHLPPEERAKVRSKTFPGIADAMAEQWGNVGQEETEAPQVEPIEIEPPKTEGVCITYQKTICIPDGIFCGVCQACLSKDIPYCEMTEEPLRKANTGEIMKSIKCFEKVCDALEQIAE